MKQVKVVLVGIGGYGGLFVKEMLENPGFAVIAGAVEPYPERSEYYHALKERNVPVFSTMNEFYKHCQADLAVISTPIFLHTEHMLTAIKHGSNVLCEKPLCADERDIDILREEKRKFGKFIYIGYQWAYSGAVSELKKDVLNGKFGRLKEMKTLVLRPRTREYFERGVGWAGKISTSDGRLVYDSVANNSAAHYLFNMLYIMGEDGYAAKAGNVFAELLRANNIENFDVSKINFTVANGAKACFIAAHPVTKTIGPIFEYVFEKGTVYYSNKPIDKKYGLMPDEYDEYGQIAAVMSDGVKKNYGDPMGDTCRKLHVSIQMTAQGWSGDGPCGLEAAAEHTKLINYIQKKFQIYNIKPWFLKEDGQLLYAEGLLEEAMSCYKDTSKSIAYFCEKD